MKTRTLFVEDEDRAVSPYFHELAQNGFECTLVNNGNEAIDILNSQKFDLVSIDIMFNPGSPLGIEIEPIRSGLKLLEMIRKGEIKNCDPDIRIVVLTAVSDPNTENEIRKLGISAYLKKSIGFTKVIQTFCNLK